MKVALITDQHFGARNDSIAFLDFFEKFYANTFIPYLLDNDITSILILGDTFDRRKYVNFYALERAKKMFFDELAKNHIEVLMLVGNHDTYYKNTNDVNSPDLLLKDYDNIRVISKPETIDICGYDVCMMPWICADNYVDSMNELKSSVAPVCMGHFEIDGFEMYRGHECHGGLDRSTFAKFNNVFSGHYHHRSTQGNITYLGTPYELTWQDYNDPKGFHVYDLANETLEFIQNPYTMFARVEYDDKGKEPVDLDTLNLADKYVKVVVVNKTDYYKFDLFVNKLYTLGCHDIKIVEDFSEFESGEVDSDVNLEDTLSILSNYIDSINTDVDKEKIKTFMKSLYTEAVNLEVV